MNEKEQKQKIVIRPDELPDLGIRVSNSHRLKLEKEGLFPKRSYLSPYKPVYILLEILDWVDQQTAKRGSADNV